MIETFSIAGYCRISVDIESDKDHNTSIENQKSIIDEYVKKYFPNSSLTFFEDRDRSGYTFTQREEYQKMRKLLTQKKFDILIIKDFSRFARRNSIGLVELESLRDEGIRIISVGDSVDYPTNDDWLPIQFRFLMNELPVTDTSKKVKAVINRRQMDGKWICSVPYGYVITNTKNMTFEVDKPAAEIVQEVFRLYNDGWGYKKIANHLTDLNIPTPRMNEIARKEKLGQITSIKSSSIWSIITIQGIIENDFYIGTLRQKKYTRNKINGDTVKTDDSTHIVFENNHEAIIDYRTFSIAQEQKKKRTTSSYRGIKKNDNVYSGFIFCGDCGQPMFAMSRRDLKPAYTCSSYHKRGLKGCSSHHTRVDTLDQVLKDYIMEVKNNSFEMLESLDIILKSEANTVQKNTNTADIIQNNLKEAYEELKATTRQHIREISREPDNSDFINSIYDELESDLKTKIKGLENQLKLTTDKNNTIIQASRVARTAIEVFEDIGQKDKLDKVDLDLIIERIDIYEDHIEISLKSDIDALLRLGKLEAVSNFPKGTEHISQITQSSRNKQDKVFRVNVISDGDPLEIYTDNDGEVIFKKYSPIGELGSFAGQYAEVLHKTGGFPVVVCDRDHVISVAGIPKKELLERRVSPALEDIMENRKSFSYTSTDTRRLQPVEGVDRYALVAAPIIAAGDVCGSIMFLSGETSTMATDTEVKLIATASAFLGRQMEE